MDCTRFPSSPRLPPSPLARLKIILFYVSSLMRESLCIVELWGLIVLWWWIWNKMPTCYLN